MACEQSLLEFDGEYWQVYNAQNSELPQNYINAIAIDSDGDKWIGLNSLVGGLVYFNGADWIRYTTDNSNIPFNHIQNIAIDKTGIIWLGSNKGLAKFDGQDWELFDISNSGLPSNDITSLAIDSLNNVWIGTLAGMAIYLNGSEIGTRNGESSLKKPAQAELFQNYPNPVNFVTTIKYRLNKPGNVVLKIFNCYGQELMLLVNEFQTTGKHEINYQPNKLPGGIYFYKLQVCEFSETKKFTLQ
ncbi:MAG: two-component regulator propeller domain-containing protein, partial [Draconibacterium sp.]|nr:two-component regulator propeller domain-containing protein [Draconibacterium sp.]